MPRKEFEELRHWYLNRPNCIGGSVWGNTTQGRMSDFYHKVRQINEQRNRLYSADAYADEDSEE